MMNLRPGGKYNHLAPALTLSLIKQPDVLCGFITPGTTTLCRSTPTLVCVMRTTSPISSSLDAWQEWLCFMENYWMVSCLPLHSLLGTFKACHVLDFNIFII